MDFGTQGANETKTALSIRKDPNHPGSPFDLLIQTLQHIRAFERAMMGSRELQKGEGFPDRLFHPFDKLGSTSDRFQNNLAFIQKSRNPFPDL